MSNVKQPASATAKVKKLLLYADDPLVKILKPDYYRIIEDGLLEDIPDTVSDFDNTANDGKSDGNYGEENNLKAPSLSDITLVSKNMVTDKNKNQFVEFVFNVKNSGGSTVIGVDGYGQ